MKCPSLLLWTRRLSGGQRLSAFLPEPFLLGTTWGRTKGTSIQTGKRCELFSKYYRIALPETVSDCRIDAQVDSSLAFRAWSRRGLRSGKLTQISRLTFQFLVNRNLSLTIHVFCSFTLESCRLVLKETVSFRCYAFFEIMGVVQRYFGGMNGHTLDLMSLDWNVQRNAQGNPFRHFTPCPTFESAGVNVFNQDTSICDGTRIDPDVFPPFSLIGPLLC